MRILAVNGVPVANEDAVFLRSLLEIAPETLTGNDTDPNGDLLTVADESNAVNGSVFIIGSAIAFRAAANFSGGASFEYTASDRKGGTDKATATVNVVSELLLQAIATNTDLPAGISGIALNGETTADNCGFSVSGAGNADPNGVQSGKSCVIFGKADGAGLNLNQVSADVGGFAIAGEKAGDFSGNSAKAAGDVNGDGFADILVGANRADGNQTDSGKSYIVFAASTAVRGRRRCASTAAVSIWT